MLKEHISAPEAYLCDIGPIVVEINEMLRGLRRWARPERHFSGLMCFPSLVTKVYKMPYGVTRDRIIFGGKGNADELRYSPTVIYPVDINESIVQTELFCPLLPVVPFEDAGIEAVLNVIESREHPYRGNRILPLLRLMEK